MPLAFGPTFRALRNLIGSLQPGFAHLSHGAPLPALSFEIIAPGLLLQALLPDSKQTLLPFACCVSLARHFSVLSLFSLSFAKWERDTVSFTHLALTEAASRC